MKFFLTTLFFLVLAVVGAFSPAPLKSSARSDTTTLNAVSSRKAFLVTSAAWAAGAATASAASADYSLDVESTPSPKAAKKEGSGGAGLVGGVFVGGLALSVPFFLPNLLRLAGVKNTKLKE